LRHDYTRDEIAALFRLPFPRLLRLAQETHETNWPDDEIQLCTLLSIKTGGCKEDCGYCPQSAHHKAQVDAHGLLDLATIKAAATAAKTGGSTRFCMGAAWRSPPSKGPQFERVLEAVREVHALGLEVCTTLGMLDEEQAQQLAEAGVHAYNHNLDTSPEYYDKVITTRTYEDRLQTLKNVRKAGMTVCCGGIVGMGEGRADRIGLLQQLSSLDPHPESVPVNLLVRVEGTPLAGEADFDVFELVRTIAVARILMPKSRVRLSAGRTEMSDEAQALCFLAGANSIFTGEKLLTTPNPGSSHDHVLLERLGMRPVAQ
jgi:biotin synthase